MKKSKVILPAMALLLFSTAASVTGTVAWFTSTRVFNTSASHFGINSVDGNLVATVAPRVGTKKGTGETIVNYTDTDTNAAARLTHGSFNHTTGDAWILNPDATQINGSDYFKNLDSEATAKGHEQGQGTGNGYKSSKWYQKSVTESGTSYDYFAAFSWQIDFEYTFGSGEQNVAIYLDVKSSSIALDGGAVRPAQNQSNAETIKGFRIAFYPVAVASGTGAETPDYTKARIFASNGTYDNAHYVTGAASANNQGTYTTNNYMLQDTDKERYTESLASATVAGYKDTICTMTSAARTARVICVAWFEGTDDNIVSNARMDNVKASLSFYGRSIVA